MYEYINKSMLCAVYWPGEYVHTDKIYKYIHLVDECICIFHVTGPLSRCRTYSMYREVLYVQWSW